VSFRVSAHRLAQLEVDRVPDARLDDQRVDEQPGRAEPPASYMFIRFGVVV
jgi:hypothetical protein